MSRPSPRDGDRVFHCGHVDKRSHHYFHIPGEPAKLRRPNGTIAEGSWIVLCDECFVPDKSPLDLICGDGIWRGNAPVHYQEPS